MVADQENDLTIEQLERIIANHEAGMVCGVAVYRQLLAVMRREARLREALQVIGDGTTKEGRTIYELATAMAIARQALKDCNG